MRELSPSEAVKISEITSSIFPQGSSWVFREMDLKTGTVRLTRGLTQGGAKRRLKLWRKEKVEQLLRTEGSSRVYAIKSLHKNPSWQGEGVWRWAFNRWYTTRQAAEEALKVKAEGKQSAEEELAVHEVKTSELPGHFVIG